MNMKIINNYTIYLCKYCNKYRTVLNKIFEHFIYFRPTRTLGSLELYISGPFNFKLVKFDCTYIKRVGNKWAQVIRVIVTGGTKRNCNTTNAVLPVITPRQLQT